IHVPMLVNWKGKLSPRAVDQMVHFTDILPTLADLCGLSLDKSLVRRLDGQSFASLFSGQRNSYVSKARYWHWNRGVPYYHQNAAMREGDWKLIYPPVTSGTIFKDVDAKPLLFNIKDDPSETTDVSSKNQAVYKRMWTWLDDWCRKMDADRLKATSYDN